jgi:hypothetical protein
VGRRGGSGAARSRRLFRPNARARLRRTSSSESGSALHVQASRRTPAPGTAGRARPHR